MKTKLPFFETRYIPVGDKSGFNEYYVVMYRILQPNGSGKWFLEKYDVPHIE